MLGIYISGHPLEKIREQIIATTNISSLQMHEIDETNDGRQVKIAAIITSVKK
ncbi:MAG: hypothetical protein V8R51_08170 [Clostridia bacterium]